MDEADSDSSAHEDVGTDDDGSKCPYWCWYEKDCKELEHKHRN